MAEAELAEFVSFNSACRLEPVLYVFRGLSARLALYLKKDGSASQNVEQ